MHHHNIMTEIEIIYRDEHLIAINKPHGLLVHPSWLARDATESAMQLLRNQVGQHVFPAHRLDRKTSGVLLFSLDKNTDHLMQPLFAAGRVHKTYLAIVRGFAKDEETIDYPLQKENGNMQDALTHYQTLARSEINLPTTRHQTSRYSLVKITPKTGRMHQIRRHFAHILHPVIGDRPHGCNKQNKLFNENFAMTTMLLHAQEMQFEHPFDGKITLISANPGDEFLRVCSLLAFNV